MAPLALVGFALLLGAPHCLGAATPTPSLPPSPTNDSDTTTEVCQGSNRCQPGVLLPVWEPDDPSLGDKAARAVVYFVAMVYMFLGVSIIADRFMASIEVITSKEKEITITKANGETSVGTVRIWNETVSNLTLMALGSSAPEILLSVIEVCGHNFQAGELGPGTIVGSAAFNMFVVIAVCVYVIPAGESRKIKHLRVFFVTASWSIFAYVWLYLILAVFSPGVVQVSTDCGHRRVRSCLQNPEGGALGLGGWFMYLHKCMLRPQRAPGHTLSKSFRLEREGKWGCSPEGAPKPSLDGAPGPGKGSSAHGGRGLPLAIFPSRRPLLLAFTRGPRVPRSPCGLRDASCRSGSQLFARCGHVLLLSLSSALFISAFPTRHASFAQVVLQSHKPALCFLTVFIALGNGPDLHNLSVDTHRYMPTSAHSNSVFPRHAVVVCTLHSPFTGDF